MERTVFDELMASIARILVGGIFVVFGIGNLLNPSMPADRLDFNGAVVLVVLIALFKITFGLAVAVRYHTRYAAAGLLLYTLFVSILFYGPGYWDTREMYEFIFFRNLGLVGGLLFIYSYSRDYSHWREDTWMSKRQKEIVTKGADSPTFNEGPPH